LVPERNDDAAHGNGEQRVDEEDVAHTNVDLTQHGDDQDRRRGEERRDLTPVEPRGAIAREYPDGNGRQAEQRERRLHDQFDDRVVPPAAAVGVAEEVRRLTARVVLHELLEPGAKLRRGNRNVTATRPRYVKAVHAPDDDAGADEAEHSGDHVCAETRDAPAGCGRDLAGAVTSAGAKASARSAVRRVPGRSNHRSKAYQAKHNVPASGMSVVARPACASTGEAVAVSSRARSAAASP